MNSRLVWFVSVSVFMLFLAAGNADGPKANPNEHLWLSDYAQARKLARETGKPIFVVFRCQH